ncbi:hypothetical protein [Kitasatospora sp. NPDC057198]|uniref:hypothetical protein n=1 Tax=Kitasatospora sp. NPDC057198 TaxID=3346046 RepID=UPI0036259328
MERHTTDRSRSVTFEEWTRACPARYFRVGRGSPGLLTEILQQAVWDALHHRDGTHGRIGVQIGSDPDFTVEDDRPRAVDGWGNPLPGFFGSLLDRDRQVPAAAAALSVRTVVEVRLDGRGHRQELVGTTATGAREEFATSEPTGTRTAFHLDPTVCTGPEAAIARTLLPEELHGPECGASPSPVAFPIRDLRAETGNPAGG